MPLPADTSRPRFSLSVWSVFYDVLCCVMILFANEIGGEMDKNRYLDNRYKNSQ